MGNGNASEPESSAGEVRPVPPFPIVQMLLAAIVIIAVALGIYYGLMVEKNEQFGSGSGATGSAGAAGSSGGGLPEFTDPTGVPELQRKAQRPDGATSWAAIDVLAKPEFTDAVVAHGKELFAASCAGCHGAEGKGDGVVPKRFSFQSLPADLSRPAESVKIRTTLMGSIPRDADLFRTITRGLPGTAMWSYREFSPADRWALVAYLKVLSSTTSATEPEIVAIPAKLPRDQDMLDLGESKFARVCANCHGATGTGPVAAPMKNPDSGKPYPGIPWARNGGTEMLGGGSEEDLARTLLCGFHKRSPMMTFKVYFYGSADPTPEQKTAGDRLLWGTVYFCRDLLKK